MLNGLTRFEWERVVRGIEMSPMTRLVALDLASYSNRMGENAHPGNKRLADDCGISDRTVERHLCWLRDKGLIERVFRGSSAGRSKQADVYRLVIADDLPDRGVTFKTPDTTDGSSPVDTDGTPDTGDGSSEQEHPTTATEHPTPGTGTPDKSAGTPDTGVAPSCSTSTIDQEVLHHSVPSGTDARAHANEPAVVAALSQTDIEMAALRELGPARCSELLDAASADVEAGDWPELVHLAYLRREQVAS